jgi:hypothetical protein
LQWFGGYLQLSQTSLSLLVALITSVIALGAFLSTLHFPGSETRVFFQAIAEGNENTGNADEQRLWLEIDNFGNRPSRIRGVHLLLHGDRDLTPSVKILQPSMEQLVVQGGRSLMLQLEVPAWSPQYFSIPTRADSKFEQLLTHKGHRLELMVVEYGSTAAPKMIEEMPAWVLPTLLCRGAQGNPPEDPAPQDSCEQLKDRLVREETQKSEKACMLSVVLAHTRDRLRRFLR